MAEDVRVDIDDVPVCDGLTFRSHGEHVLVLGAPRAFFEAVTGLTPVVRGTIHVRGMAAAEAAQRGILAGVPLDPPLPPDWTPAEYVRQSARLAGLSRAEAREGAAEAIAKLQLGAMANVSCSRLVLHARRATVVAAALATGAAVIALEDPLGGLADDVVATYGKLLEGALADRAWMVFGPRVPLTSALALDADEAILATAVRVDGQGPPATLAATQRRFVGRAIGDVAALAPQLSARGGSVEICGVHVVFDLGPSLTTGELLAMCAALDVAIVELLPVARALS